MTLLDFGAYKVKTVRRICRDISQSFTGLSFVRNFGSRKWKSKTQ
jgi:hypothetical protein